MNKRWHASWTRVGLALLIVFGALYALYGVTIELTPWYQARSMCRDNPFVKLVPVPLPDQGVAPLAGTRLEADGFSIQFPWSEAPQRRNGKTLDVIAFPTRGVGMILFGPSQTAYSAAYPQIRKSAGEILGEETAHSRYQLTAAELAASPDQVRWWKAPRENAKYFYLLAMKSMILQNWGCVYILNQGNVRGFQVGDPAKPPYRVDLRLFDSDDREYEILITPKSKAASSFSQAEVNAIVASLQPNP